ncbi:uncharacterized protein TRIVIDRAFT_63740 [Trichoderma virens Gv29-8]|uniref:Uncharacterized protein n=1 Tax=Hypocrea virens (strain Gv29-8 / FGSC 10586) TaxID=413071 RepID=G9MFY2_HYPVG|nr:uncharacterized protein TRIVIDRAFT_63740 [Trichoderma virens Gv29-8]EHK26433.1 hypothetical protein TRIVIDRAFT_63740 [Trichoderma virens Gv29-8]
MHRTNPCDGTGRLEMKVEFRYVHPVSASASASTPFAFPSPCAGKVDPEALGWAGLDAQSARQDWRFCKSTTNDTEPRPGLRTPCHTTLTSSYLDLAVKALRKRPGVLLVQSPGTSTRTGRTACSLVCTCLDLVNVGLCFGSWRFNHVRCCIAQSLAHAATLVDETGCLPNLLLCHSRAMERVACKPMVGHKKWPAHHHTPPCQSASTVRTNVSGWSSCVRAYVHRTFSHIRDLLYIGCTANLQWTWQPSPSISGSLDPGIQEIQIKHYQPAVALDDFEQQDDESELRYSIGIGYYDLRSNTSTRSSCTLWEDCVLMCPSRHQHCHHCVSRQKVEHATKESHFQADDKDRRDDHGVSSSFQVLKAGSSDSSTGAAEDCVGRRLRSGDGLQALCVGGLEGARCDLAPRPKRPKGWPL